MVERGVNFGYFEASAAQLQKEKQVFAYIYTFGKACARLFYCLPFYEFVPAT